VVEDVASKYGCCTEKDGTEGPLRRRLNAGIYPKHPERALVTTNNLS